MSHRHKRRSIRKKPFQHLKSSPQLAEQPFRETEESGHTTYYVHGPRGIHAQKADGEWQWMMQDGLGSVRGVVDNELSVHQSIAYDPYGNPIDIVGPDQTIFGYTGEHVDENDLVYLRERYYNPHMGIFISQDPLEGTMNNPMSLNQYSYVHGNPVNLTDPSGTAPYNPTPSTPSGVSASMAQIVSHMASSDPQRMAGIMNTGMCSALFQPDPCVEELRRRLGYSPSIRQIISNCYNDQSPAQPTPTSQPIMPTPTLPVQTLIPPSGNFVTPTPIPGAQNPYYCSQGADTPGIPLYLTCPDPNQDTQEELVAHVLFTEAGGTLDRVTMANVAQVIRNRRGTDSVGGAMNPATIVQRSALTVGSVRDVTFAGILKPADRSTAEWQRAMQYANALMQAHAQGLNQPNYAEFNVDDPKPELGSTIYYCAVNDRGRNILDSNGVVVFYEETSSDTYHVYTTTDCGQILR